jgi:hypothetical protein
MISVNSHRGEIMLTLAGTPYRARLTLGSLAELEGALGVAGLGALAARFADRRLHAADVIAILGAALRGAGHALTDAEVAHRVPAGEIGVAARAAGELLALTFGAGEGARGRPFPDSPSMTR